jgi:hypothetical protein
MPADLPTTKRGRPLAKFHQARPLSESSATVEDTIDEDSPPDVEPEVEMEDVISIPSFELPPGRKVASYSEIAHHLKQSKFIFDAFQNTFSMIS